MGLASGSLPSLLTYPLGVFLARNDSFHLIKQILTLVSYKYRSMPVLSRFTYKLIEIVGLRISQEAKKDLNRFVDGRPSLVPTLIFISIWCFFSHEFESRVSGGHDIEGNTHGILHVLQLFIATFVHLPNLEKTGACGDGIRCRSSLSPFGGGNGYSEQPEEEPEAAKDFHGAEQ